MCECWTPLGSWIMTFLSTLLAGFVCFGMRQQLLANDLNFVYSLLLVFFAMSLSCWMWFCRELYITSDFRLNESHIYERQWLTVPGGLRQVYVQQSWLWSDDLNLDFVWYAFFYDTRRTNTSTAMWHCSLCSGSSCNVSLYKAAATCQHESQQSAWKT
jgi:hypothetical protein